MKTNWGGFGFTQWLTVAAAGIHAMASLGVTGTSFAGTPPLPQIPTNQFFITNYGAVGNGVSNSAAAIQGAINAAGAAGGGTVVVSAVGVLTNYLSGPINLTNNCSLQINSGAKLQMLAKGSWPSGSIPFIYGTNLHDVAINGSGTIDGQGSGWWSGGGTRPYLVSLNGCTRILVQNVTVQNSPMYHLALMGGNIGVTVQGVTVNTVSNSPNTDGIDLTATNSLIQNCSISDGDDNISIKCTGFQSVDIMVSNCTFGFGHGVSVGSDTSGGVENFTVSNCTFNGTENGIRLKSDNASSGSGAGGLVQNLAYYDITMTNVEYPLILYSYYNEVGTPDEITPQTAAGETIGSTNHTVVWRNITISNLTATALTGKNISGVIWGRPELVVSNVTLDDVSFSAPTKTFCVYNARAIQIIDSNLTAPNTTTNTLTLYNAQVTVTNRALNSNLVTLGGLSKPPTNNVLAFFNAEVNVTDTNALGPDPFLTLGGAIVTVSTNLNLGSTSMLNFALGTNAATVAVIRNLTTGGTFNISDAGGLTNAAYTLFTYGGTLAYNAVTIGTTPNTSFTYTVSASIVGQVNLIVGSTTPLQDPFVTWQLTYFGCTNLALCPQATGDADPLGKGISNTNQFLLGLNPTNPASVFRILSVVPQSGDMVVTWATGGGPTNVVQAMGGDGSGGYSNNFTDVSGPIAIPGSGDTTNTYIDIGGGTNMPSRYYRVRLVP